MDSQNYNTVAPERKRGAHLQREDRGAIRSLRRLGMSLRRIARELNCAPSTVSSELKRGTPPRKSNRGRAPDYSAKLGQAEYECLKSRNHKPHKMDSCGPFVAWVTQQVRVHRWSLDACVGYARLHRLFKETAMVCTKTLYNELWAGRLPLPLFEVPEALKRKPRKGKPPESKNPKDPSIEERPAVVAARGELGHWECDTVVGRRNGKEAVVFTLLERVTDHYLAIRIPGKTSEAVGQVLKALQAQFGGRFSRVFRSITADNGPEFAGLTQAAPTGTKVYFAHPYCSWERGQN